MTEAVAVDTDVLLKIAAYRLSTEFLRAVAVKGSPALLGLTHIIAEKQLRRRSRRLHDADLAMGELRSLLEACGQLEPDDNEVRIAAALADVAQDRGLPLDPGEAQLAAIVANRSLPMLVTGDKRAIAALSQLIEGMADRDAFVGRLACLEQIILAIAELIGDVAVRERICAEPEVDGAMRLACSCGRAAWDPAQLREACASFIRALRTEVGDLLAGESALA